MRERAPVLRNRLSTCFSTVRAEIDNTEARRQQIREKHDAALAQARAQAGEMIRQSRAALEKDIADAKLMLQQQADSLAKESIDSILRPAVAAGGR